MLATMTVYGSVHFSSMAGKTVSRLQPCVVRSQHTEFIGLFYFENDRVLILLNNLVQDADLGPLKPIRRRHAFPEAEVVVIPKSDVLEMSFVGSRGKA